MKILCELKPYMRPLLTKMKAAYRRTLRSAKLEFMAKKELDLVREAERHLWLRGSRPRGTTCPVQQGVLREHFKKTVAEKCTIPTRIPEVNTEWPVWIEEWRSRLQADSTNVEVYEAAGEPHAEARHAG